MKSFKISLIYRIYSEEYILEDLFKPKSKPDLASRASPISPASLLGDPAFVGLVATFVGLYSIFPGVDSAFVWLDSI